MLPPPPASGLMVQEGLVLWAGRCLKQFSSQPRGGQSQRGLDAGNWGGGGGSHAVGQEAVVQGGRCSVPFSLPAAPTLQPPRSSVSAASQGRALYWGEQTRVDQSKGWLQQRQHTDVSR